MNKKTVFWLLLLSMIMFTIPVKADATMPTTNEVTETQLIKAKATAYCLHGVMANGEYVHNGACAGADKYYGKTITMFKRLPDDSLGDYIGTYTVEDKGGTRGIKQGYVIDIWRPTLKACQEFMDLVYEEECHGNVYIIVKEN